MHNEHKRNDMQNLKNTIENIKKNRVEEIGTDLLKNFV